MRSIFIVLATFTCLLSNISSAQAQPGTGMNIVALQIGDSSCDGHCKTEHKIYFSSLSIPQIKLAYANAAKQIGYDFVEIIATEYDDRKVSEDFLLALRQNGIHIELNNRKSISNEEYFAIYIAMVRLIQPQSKFLEINPPTENIGGYGLFE